MRLFKGTIGLVAALAISGCATSSVTNLTPTHHPRNPENVYPVDIEFRTNLRTIKPETIRPYVQIGDDNYLMRRTAVVKDRWETLIPIRPPEKVVNYRIKIDFKYNALPEPKVNSVLDGPFQIVVGD
jgi:hypothetical protein